MTKIGDNNPPEPTPFEQSREEITDLYAEAKNFLDGEPIATEGQAEAVQTLMRSIQAAHNKADERRKIENKPFDDGKAEVQARYNELIGDTKQVKGLAVRAVEACKQALVPWLQAQEAKQQEEARKAREEAERKQREADEAMRAARESADLEAKEEAERKLREAAAYGKAANKVEKSTAKVSGAGRAASLRTTYIPEIVNLTEAARHYWVVYPSEFEVFILDMARKDIAAGKRSIPGINIKEEKSVA